jgi:UDP-2-acetamido-2-deoxy-ribo-hexuluronate aminotransferase
MPDTTLDPAAPVEFIDLAAQRRRIGARMDDAILRVVNHGKYIMGPEVGELERKLAEFCGVKHCIGVANGTDALLMALMAKGVKSGDAVLVPAFTFAATAEPVVLLGATPIFVDVLEDSFNMDPAGLEAGIASAKRLGLRPVAAITVDLFGQPADYDRIEPILAKHGLWLLADAAQSFGASYRGRKVGKIGDIATTSFFPAKPLGCYGDGGAVFTDDDGIAAILRSLRMHGQGTDKYDNARIGVNGRLDTIQAAVLLEKLAIFPDEIVARDRVARHYGDALDGLAAVPRLIEGASSVWAQYTLRLGERDRDAVAAKLKTAGIPTAVYYPRSLHRQPAYRDFPVAGNGAPVSERLARQVLSLPMHAYLDEAAQTRICAALRAALS